MKVATWNVNSIRARRERALAFLERHEPDVLCLQELKVTNEAFPQEDFEALGYHCVLHGQKTYHGVGILARSTPTAIRRGLEDGVEDDSQARLVRAEIDGVTVLSAYFPNGGTVGGPRYPYKLSWMKRLRAYLDRTCDPNGAILLCGDFNVAPDDLDVVEVFQWQGSVLTHPEVRQALAHIAGFGLVDVVRKHVPEGGPPTWWDYRQLAFPKGNGLRIDHIFATAQLAERCTAVAVDRNERKGKAPSDHAPVLAEFA